MKKLVGLTLLAGLFPWSLLCAAQSKLSIGEAVTYALSHRPELRASDARITAATGRKQQAALPPNPRFIFRKEDNRVGTSPFGDDSQTYWEANELIETSGKRGGRIAVANAEVEKSRMQRELVRRRTMLAVRTAYWKARAAQLLANLYDADSAFSSQMIDYHQARLGEGKIAEVDFLRVRVQAQQVRAAAATAHLDAEKAKLDLAREINAPGDENWDLTDSIEDIEDPWQVPAGQDPTLLRVEGQLARQAVSQAQAQERLEHAIGRPDLIFTAGYKRDVNVDAPIAGVQFDVPLFNRNQGAVAAARAETTAADDDFQSTRNRLRAELAFARKQYEMRRDQYANVFKPLREEAVEISNITRDAYQAGGLDLVRLLDAEQARVDAEMDYVRALENYHISVTELNYAEGTDQ